MSLAKKCDRCENLYEPESTNICGVIINGLGLIIRDKQNANTVSRKYFDLCPECLISLSNWLKNEPVTFNEIRQAAGLDLANPVNESNKIFVKLCPEKENKDDQT